MFEKLTRLLALWHAKLKHWDALWQVRTFIGTLACKMKSWNAFGTQTHWHWSHAATEARWHVNQVSTQVRLHADHADMQASMLRNLENSNGSILLWKPLRTISLPSKSAYQISRVSFFFSLRFSVLLFP